MPPYFLLASRPVIQRYSFLGAGLCLFLSYTIPVFLPPWPTPYHELLTVIALVLLVVALSCSTPQWQLSFTACVLLLIAFIPVLQKLFGIIWFWGDAWLVFLYLAAMAVSFIVGQNILHQQHRTRILQGLCTVLLLVGLLNVFFVINHYFDLGLVKEFMLTWQGRPKGNLLQPNNFASCLLLCFLCGWYFFEKSLISRRVFYLWVVFMCIGLVLAQSRTTILTAVLLLAAYGFFSRRIVFKTRYRDIGFTSLCFVGWSYGLPLINEWLVVDVGDSGRGALREMEIYDQYRIGIWHEALLAISQNPWGYGWNQVGVAQILVNSPLENVVYFRHAHNVLLDIIIANGLIVGGVIIIAALFFVWQLLRYCRSIDGWFVLVLTGVIATHAMLELPLHYTYFLLPAALFLGLADTADTKDKPQYVLAYSAPWHIPLVLIGSICIALIWHDYNIIRKEHYQLNIELKGIFKREPENENTHNIILMTQRRAHLDFGRADVTANMSNKRIEWMKKVSHRFASPYYLAKYAKACYLNGRQHEAKRVLQVIKRINGKNLYQQSKDYIYNNN